MQVFLVSLRTARIYGPAVVLELQEISGQQVSLQLSWPGDTVLDEWEGYAVVVPERDEVWGAGKPEVADQQLIMQFAFQPQPIPPRDRKMFQKLVAELEQKALAQQNEVQEKDEDA